MFHVSINREEREAFYEACLINLIRRNCRIGKITLKTNG